MHKILLPCFYFLANTVDERLRTSGRIVPSRTLYTVHMRELTNALSGSCPHRTVPCKSPAPAIDVRFLMAGSVRTTIAASREATVTVGHMRVLHSDHFEGAHFLPILLI